MAWRLVVEKEIVEQLKETSNYTIGEIKILEEIIRKILRYDLDVKSKAYFDFLQSTINQLRSLLEVGQFKKRPDGGYNVL